MSRVIDLRRASEKCISLRQKEKQLHISVTASEKIMFEMEKKEEEAHVIQR